MPEKRADTLLKTMRVIEHFTLQRAWQGLSDDELFWEPMAGSWGVRRRAECQTPTPFGDGDWVLDFDTDLVMAAIQGHAVEPLTTIGWLMWHIGSMPERLAQLDFLGESKTTDTGWTSPYLTDHRMFTNAADAVDSMQAGWRVLERSLAAATDDELEQPTRGYSYSDEPGPATYGAAVIATTLNEVSHHGSQICTLRDLYAFRTAAHSGRSDKRFQATDVRAPPGHLCCGPQSGLDDAQMLDTYHKDDVVPVVLQKPDPQGTLTVGFQAGDGLLKIKGSTDPANAKAVKGTPSARQPGRPPPRSGRRLRGTRQPIRRGTRDQRLVSRGPPPPAPMALRATLDTDLPRQLIGAYQENGPPSSAAIA